MKNQKELTATANYSKRTYTIRTYFGKFRTYRMSKQDFNDARHRTSNDWVNALNSECYEVK